MEGVEFKSKFEEQKRFSAPQKILAKSSIFRQNFREVISFSVHSFQEGVKIALLAPVRTYGSVSQKSYWVHVYISNDTG